MVESEVLPIYVYQKIEVQPTSSFMKNGEQLMQISIFAKKDKVGNTE